MKSTIRRRRFLQGAAAASAATGLRPSEAAEASKTLVIASPATPQSLDQAYDVSLGTVDAYGALYDRLIQFKKIEDPHAPGVLREDTDVHPDQPYGLALEGVLAEKWELSPDGTHATFTLRQGVKSSWGNMLTAEDVKYSYLRKLHAPSGPFFSNLMGLRDADQIKVEAPNVVSFTLPKPTPLALKIHTNMSLSILDSTKMKQVSSNDDPWAASFLKNESAGFGPYRLKQIVRGQQAVFEGRADYFGGKPFMETVIMREVPSSSSRLALLKGGTVDIAQFLLPRECMSLNGSSDVTFDAVAASYAMWLELNAKMPPFDNPLVRQAVNYLIPRDQILQTIYYGLADKQTACIPEGYPLVNYSYFHYDENVDMARSLLKQAGLADGFKTTISYDAGNPVQEPIALIYQTSLRRVGIELTLDKLPSGVFYENVSKRQKPLIFYQDSPWTPDAGYSTSLYFYSKSFVDYSNYNNPDVDALIQKGMTVMDDTERRQIFDDVQKTIMNDAPWGFLVYPKYVLARKKNLQGFTYYTSNNLRFQDFRRV